MALPTPINLQTLNYAYQGQPFCRVPAKTTIDLETMDYSYEAQPFVSNLISMKDIIQSGIIAFPR
ncbi:hypothetical protein KKC06_06850 [Patescibacteria group bacterium]|nr:hypothetical protein [Patescibacteria group bacterium]